MEFRDTHAHTLISGKNRAIRLILGDSGALSRHVVHNNVTFEKGIVWRETDGVQEDDALHQT